MASNVTVPNAFANATTADATAVNANFTALVNWINTNAVHLDGSKAFTAVPSGPATDPTNVNHLVRKAYVDAFFPVVSANIGSGQVKTANLDQTAGTQAVTTATIRDAAVTGPKLADNIIDKTKMAANYRLLFNCTSTTRPSSPSVGDMIYETDKNRLRLYDGSWLLIAGYMGGQWSGTGQVINATANANLSADTESADTDSIGAVGSATMTIPESGMWTITVDLTATAGSPLTGFGTEVTIIAGGRTYDFNWQMAAGSSHSLTIPLNATNTVVVNVKNNSSGSITVSHLIHLRRISQ